MIDIKNAVTITNTIIHNMENLQHHLDLKRITQTLLERVQMELERVQVMTRDSINSIVENSFGGNRWLALMVTSRILVLTKPLTTLFEGGDRGVGRLHCRHRRHHLLSLLSERGAGDQHQER